MTAAQQIDTAKSAELSTAKILTKLKAAASPTAKICHAPKAHADSDKLAAKNVLQRILANAPRSESVSSSEIRQDINEIQLL